ncbi:AMP-binding protein [Actinokineospora globicatena]|uniref:AMP-binding protein n=1 Tax=Actinokineospora globicatena TaxID=103729 RepID=UPI0020A4102F|nr:AMP-binding protein [Actinokineospora globicatena]MCP2301680.1 long-chain acyl-CoA synthetase [Actinokineospora globicatena]GLW76665.1 long-chain acyl-CoA synthetase [Actinokineospora globicatena]GLW83498.1 long-chain acyl-CoA synthetase [Actinokineospora globicatena]
MADTPTRNVADLVTAASENVPAHLGLVDVPESRSLSWQRLDTAVSRYANTLVGVGLAPGDRVALVMSNDLQACVVLFAVLRAGAVAVPLGTDAVPREVERVLDHSGVCFAFGVPRVTDRTGGVVTALPDPVLDDSPEPVPPFPAVGGGEDIALLCHTSGTAGTPRGVMLSHRALLANAAQCAALRPAPVTPTDRVLLAVPLAHAYGLSGLWQVALTGATGVLTGRFTVDTALDACREHRVTTLVGVPAIYQALATAGRDRLGDALATARMLTSGAAPLDPRTLALFQQQTGLPIYEGYGLTETGPVLTSTLVGGAAKPGSVGRAIPGVELRLVDADGAQVANPADEDDPDFGDDSDTGLVAARGQNLFSGYWPDGADGPDADGWFRTGDVGYFDPDGDLRLVDRAGDLIIVNGFNVYPHEVEQVVAELPEVAEVAAVGVPDERAGERVKLVVVARAGVELTRERLLEHCRVNLARFKVPTVVEFAAELPHSATGKIRRAGLRGSVEA